MGETVTSTVIFSIVSLTSKKGMGCPNLRLFRVLDDTGNCKIENSAGKGVSVSR